MILLLEDNVMVTLPIVELAQTAGQTVYVAENASDALTRICQGGLDGAVFNMQLATPELISTALGDLPVACYGPHVEGEWFTEYRRLGVREVWPNSKLRVRLAQWLPQILKSL